MGRGGLPPILNSNRHQPSRVTGRWAFSSASSLTPRCFTHHSVPPRRTERNGGRNNHYQAVNGMKKFPRVRFRSESAKKNLDRGRGDDIVRREQIEQSTTKIKVGSTGSLPIGSIPHPPRFPRRSDPGFSFKFGPSYYKIRNTIRSEPLTTNIKRWGETRESSVQFT